MGSGLVLTRVSIVSTPVAGSTYGVDEAIRVEVFFGEEVHVTEDGGDLSLVLSIGENPARGDARRRQRDRHADV